MNRRLRRQFPHLHLLRCSSVFAALLFLAHFAQAQVPAVPPPVLSEELGLDPMGCDWGCPKWQLLPGKLLWQPPLADPRAPRMYVKTTNLNNDFTTDTIDTAIGGEVGLVRYTPCWCAEPAFQLDVFAVHFSRWSDRHLAVAGDYRYGIPLTFRQGPWQAKIAYEHTSTHLGDDFIKDTGRFKVPYVRDEIVLGLSYRWWNQLRLYGEFACAFYIESPVLKRNERFSWGLEWSRQAPTGWGGQPYAAFNMDLRPEQNFDPGMTLQAGWQWLPEDLRLSFRLGLEFFHGRSPYGQFLTTAEEWLGLGIYLDF